MDRSSDGKGVRNLTVPPAEMLKLLILEKREAVLEAIELYNSWDFQGIDAETYAIKSRVITLFLELQAALRNDLKPEEYEDLRVAIFASDEIKSVIDAFYLINNWLYDKKVTQFDNRPDRKPKSVEEANKFDGFS